MQLAPHRRVARAHRLGRGDRRVGLVGRPWKAARSARPKATFSTRMSRSNRAGRRTARGGPRSSRRRRGRPGSGRRRAGTACSRASSRPSRRRRGGGRRGAAPSRRAADRGRRRRHQRQAHQQAPVLERVARGTRSRGWRRRAPGAPRDRPRATAGSPASSRWRRTSNSRAATGAGSSLRAYTTPSATRNRTRWRDGPTGSSRNRRAVARPAASGCSHGRSSRPATSSRRRSRGKLTSMGLAAAGGAPLRAACGGRPRARVVAQGLEQLARVRTVVAGGDLEERDALSRADPLDLRDQRLGDAALAGARVHDQGDDPDEPLVGLEPRDHGGTRRTRGPPPPAPRRGRCEPGDENRSTRAREVARPGRIPLVGEQRGEALGVRGGRAARIVMLAVSFMARWYPAAALRSRARGPRDDARTGPRTGPGEQHLAPSGPSRLALSRAPAREPRRPAVEARRGPQVQRARTLAVAGERRRRAALRRGLEQHGPVARQARPRARTRAKAPRCGSAASGGAGRRPRRRATAPARPRRGPARPSPSRVPASRSGGRVRVARPRARARRRGSARASAGRPARLVVGDSRIHPPHLEERVPRSSVWVSRRGARPRRDAEPARERRGRTRPGPRPAR